jgi:hypothetical protein
MKFLSLATLLLTTPALAGAEKEPEIESTKALTLGFGVGLITLNNEDIQSVYGGAVRGFPQLSLGLVPWSRYVHIEVNSAVGFAQFKGTEQFLAGGESADEVWLTVLPMHVDLLLGIDIAREQPVVPYGGFGLAMAMWREVTGDSEFCGTSGTYCGNHYGYNGFFGAALLLDRIEPERAAKVDANSGINDAYFTLEGRYADVGWRASGGKLARSGLSFGGWSAIFGLKLVI